jgi:2-polyprenyl-6-methoxyphenol hydroxylase-like FAD-dependent oxidoreductase
MSGGTGILVVGAGPTGLALALQAHDHGARVRIVDRRPDAFRPSRALILYPRTLEVLRPLGVTGAVLERADYAPRAKLHLKRTGVTVQLGKFVLPDTAFPHLTLVRQMDVESVLTQALAERDVHVERNTEVVAVTASSAEAHAVIRSVNGTETYACEYIVGCDGPDSNVRHCAGISWPGGAYGQEVVLADVELDGSLDESVSHVAIGRHGLVLAFALGEQATWRMLASQQAGRDQLPFGQPGPSVPREDLERLLKNAGFKAEITDVAWSARYRLQHRLATQFRAGRLFLVGDAAHAYSPATGQGMNTGIQDALNLGWKLAFASSATERETLLDSYNQERQPIVRRALALTHLAFWFEASPRLLPSLVRGAAVSVSAPVIPFFANRRRLIGEVISRVSQLRTGYQDSPLSTEGTPPAQGSRFHPGYRLPDATVTCGDREVRVHALLARPGVHVLLRRDAAQDETEDFGPRVHVHRILSALSPDVVAVRPDGYVGFRCGVADRGLLRSWLSRLGACT